MWEPKEWKAKKGKKKKERDEAWVGGVRERRERVRACLEVTQA